MTTKKTISSKDGSSFSIDQWQDVDPVNVPWFDNPFLGPLILSAISVLLIGCSALMLPWFGGSKSSNNSSSFVSVSPLVPEALPSGSTSGHISASSRNLSPLAREYFERHENSPTAVTDLIAEMLEKEEMHSSFFREQLNLHGCSDGEMLRQLTTRLKGTKDAKQFERIVIVLHSMSNDIRALPEMTTHIPRGLAAAAQRVEVAQLRKMKDNVPNFVFRYSQLPECSGLLAKLASIDDQWNRRVLTKLRDFEGEDSAQLALRIVQKSPSHLEMLLNFRESEAVCQYLWKGKLAGKKDFEDLAMGGGEASLKAFSQVIGSMSDEDPESAVEAVMSMYDSNFITRDAVSEEAIRKMDETISAKVEAYLRNIEIVEGESIGMAQQRERMGEPGPFAFLYLAELFGGRKTALQIVRIVEEAPAIPKRFKSIGDALLAINEPDSYDALVEVWTMHSYSDSKHLNALKENVGQAIESNFLKKLTNELGKEKKDTKRISAMIRAIEQVGTTKSISTLNKMNNIRTGRVSSKARDAIYEIQQREKSGN